MNTQEKLAFLKEAIVSLKGNNDNFTLTETTNLLDLGLDSLDIVELQLYYEDKTGKIAKDPTTAVLTAGQLINLME